MSTIAFIPARAGSKSIKSKNIKQFNGRPLIYWSLSSLQKCAVVDEIHVSTDSEEIASCVSSFGFSKVKVFMRDPENATDKATTESAMMEFINRLNLKADDTFLLVQATSPFTRAVDFENAITQFRKSKSDSLLSVVRQKRFLWKADGTPINYDYKQRPRRQDFDGFLMENGAFYISSVGAILKNENRLSGNISVYEMPEYTAIELDEEDDWLAGEVLMRKHAESEMKPKIKLLLTDVDGVLTDAGMYYSEKGDELKKFCTYDGMAFKLFKEKGIPVGILTSENCDLNRRRADKLKLDYQFHGVSNKLEIVEKLVDGIGISLNEVAYVGDDINDLELLQQVGIAACPANAQPEIKNISNIIHLKKSGGDGVIRELLNLLFP